MPRKRKSPLPDKVAADLKRQTRLEMREGARVSKLHAQHKFRYKKGPREYKKKLTADEIAANGHTVLHPGEDPPLFDPAVKLPEQHRRLLRTLEAMDDPKLLAQMRAANEIYAALIKLCATIDG
jgi:hypothetical protein